MGRDFRFWSSLLEFAFGVRFWSSLVCCERFVCAFYTALTGIHTGRNFVAAFSKQSNAVDQHLRRELQGARLGLRAGDLGNHAACAQAYSRLSTASGIRSTRAVVTESRGSSANQTAVIAIQVSLYKFGGGFGGYWVTGFSSVIPANLLRRMFHVEQLSVKHPKLYSQQQTPWKKPI